MDPGTRDHIHTFRHTFLAEVPAIDWLGDLTALHRQNVEILKRLAEDKSLMKELILGARQDPYLWSKCEEDVVEDKIVLWDDMSKNLRIRLRMSTAPQQRLAHSHRFSSANRMLRGEYIHWIYRALDSFDPMTKLDDVSTVLQHVDRSGDTFTIHHDTLHSTPFPKFGTVSLVLRGNPLEERAPVMFKEPRGRADALARIQREERDLTVMPLFVSDLDGTLLGADATLGPGERERLNALLARGVQFTVATSRGFPSIKSILGNLALRLPVIEQNGALVREFDSGRVLHHAAMSQRDAERVLEVFSERGFHPFVSVLDGSRNPLVHGRLDNPDMEWYLEEKRIRGGARGTEAGGQEEWRSLPVLSMTYLGTRRTVEELETAVRSRCAALRVTSSDNAYTGGAELGVSGSKGDKGHALGFLRRCLGAPAEVYAFGDNENDLPLFQAADVAVAVPDATPGARAAADLVVERCADNPVIRFIEKLVAEP